MIVRLKAIESREDIFCYLSSYLHRSLLCHLVIVTSNHCIIKSSMRRPLVIGPRGDRLQAIESSRARAVAETSTRIVAPSDRPQAIESSSPRVVAGRPRGIEVLSRFAIGSSSSGYPKVTHHFSLNAKPHLVRVPR